MKRLLGSRAIERLAVLELGTRRAAGGGGPGERPSGAAGAGTIFLEHRTYSPGDDLRYVDWNAYGRLGSLHVKVYELEENLDVHLLVDASASMGRGRGSKLEAGCRVAAMVGAAALARGDVVRLRFLPARRGGNGRRPPARAFAGWTAAGDLLEALGDAGDLGGTGGSTGAREPLGDALRAAFPRLRRRGFGLLVTDFLDRPEAWRRAVDFLAYRRVELVCAHVVAPEERDPPIDGPVRLRDAETGERYDLEVDDELLARYRRAFERRLREVRAYLRAKRVRHVLVDSGHAGEEALLKLLLHEKVLR